MVIHQIVVHFSVGSLAIGALLLLVGLATNRTTIESIATLLLVAGALSSVPAIVTGLWMGSPPEQSATHAALGGATVVLGLLSVLIYLIRKRVTNADLACNALFIITAALALGTMYIGSAMDHGTRPSTARTFGGVTHTQSTANQQTSQPTAGALGTREP